VQTRIEPNGTAEQIRSFVLAKFPLAKKRGLQFDSPSLDSGIVDSLGVLDIVTFLEREFAIAVTDDDLTPENFGTVMKLAEFVADKTNSPA
jgi:acyl carrier protein